MSNRHTPAPKPREVDGGIKARSRRGAIGRTWWSERFLAVLESLGVAGRLQRGQHYARRGQVVDLRVDAGSVTARVQGSRSTPYRVRLGVTAFGKREWAQVERALADRARYTATLLAGEMPEDIEDVFTTVGLSLFPADAGALSMDCSCPDWEVPCKHLAAVCYLLAESFDEDPFAILGWRGRAREDLLDNLRALRSDGPPAADRAEHRSPAVPLSDCLEGYFAWRGEPARAGGLRSHARGDALLDQVPAPDITILGQGLVELLRPAYPGASALE